MTVAKRGNDSAQQQLELAGGDATTMVDARLVLVVFEVFAVLRRSKAFIECRPPRHETLIERPANFRLQHVAFSKSADQQISRSAVSAAFTVA